jgi:anti-sigma B factor antagonist
MSSLNSFDGVDGAPQFVCTWRQEGETAASVQVSGELDMATVPQLGCALADAFAHALLVVVDVSAVSFMDTSSLDVLLAAAKRARNSGGRMVMVGASRQIETVLEITGLRDALGTVPLPVPRTDPMLDPVPATSPDARPASSERGDGFDPLANPANNRVTAGRVMDVPGPGLWLHASEGAVLRAWAAPAGGLSVPAGETVEIYLDHHGALNGWRHADFGVSINQRRLPPGADPATAAPLACRGTCGVTWQAPAAAELTDHGERCLTCAGPLARA